MFKILISACLLGEKVRYDGQDCLQMHPRLQQYMKEKKVVTICPEMAGGLPTPRPPSEIEPHGSAEAILRFEAKVLTKNGDDVSREYIKGAEKALELAQKYDIRCAILKARSPSCGSKQVYDGTHSKKLVDGMGAIDKAQQILRPEFVEAYQENRITDADIMEMSVAELTTAIDENRYPQDSASRPGSR